MDFLVCCQATGKLIHRGRWWVNVDELNGAVALFYCKLKVTNSNL